ncbi:MAG: hypothetical protein IIB83_05630 [Bacteroidetes bacterium]|nr:hypothetical protein [Bacteroidota bacterium]
MKKPITFLLFVSAILFSSLTYSQNDDINETLSNLSTSAAIPYIDPIISAFGSNLNSGWVSKLPSAKMISFNLDLKIVGMGSFFEDNEKTFSTSGAFRFTSSQANQLVASLPLSVRANIKDQILSQEFNVAITGPTIIGSDAERVKVTFAGPSFDVSGNSFDVAAQTFTLNDVKGFLNNLEILPTAAVQLGIGTFAGTNFMFRWLPDIDVKDLGKFSFWGVGALHNPAVWFDGEMPFDLAFGGFYQKLTVGTIFETKASQFGVYISKTLGAIVAFTPYIGLTTETSTTTINYDYEFDTPAGVSKSNIKFELEGKNTVGFTVGASFKLAILNFNVDYKIANVKTISAGLNFGF